ncbi:MAG: hypothetical protein A2987_03680 [Omnitrophica bacterium RIFCSPLOWO2_01_FULL_45_10]|nr:MAG: hypothetical protein A2987_03680 [Omnitrophica bacterium RIFCSPLOWO2_01_FULL_45_10]
MFRRTTTILGIAAIIICMARGAFAMMGCDMGGSEKSGMAHAQDVKETSKAVEVGNKTCPMTGEAIDEKTKATYEYNGKAYNFCCSMCIDGFKKDPEKYSAKAEKE